MRLNPGGFGTRTLSPPCISATWLTKSSGLGTYPSSNLKRICRTSLATFHCYKIKKTHDFKTMKVKIFWDLYKLIVVTVTLGFLGSWVKCFNCEFATWKHIKCQQNHYLYWYQLLCQCMRKVSFFSHEIQKDVSRPLLGRGPPWFDLRTPPV